MAGVGQPGAGAVGGGGARGGGGCARAAVSDAGAGGGAAQRLHLPVHQRPAPAGVT